MTEATVESSYRFGRCELQPAERRLLVAGEPVALATRAFDLLVVLVECAGQLVTKDELLERVWPNLVVEENNLQVQVAALRKLLGAAAIATVVGHGYRFTLEVERCAVARAPAAGIVRHNLPQQVSSFVGRERELAEVKRLLMQGRLVTLVGVGGIGKTRLSLQVSAEVIDDYANGVWFVELAPLTDGALVAQAVASVLGVKEEAGRPVLEALLRYVQQRQLLLILNNCEHLGQPCAELTKRLLQAGSRLKILTSSREHLHVSGETSYPVPALSVPDSRQTITPTALTQYEAVRLFIDRAAAAQPAFAVTDQNAAAVADICERLDGIPLALELAAARVRALSVEKIAARLSDRFRLLTGGDATALQRQQTLRACLDWSYELLTEAERVLLRRLAVFAGGWTLEAAEAVGAGGEIEELDVVELLTHLVEKSLVLWEAQGERYRMLETVRQYAQERLNASGEEERVRTQHLNFYLAFAEKARPELIGPKQAAWLTQLGLERENILVAHTWCSRVERGAEQGLRLVWAMKNYWVPRCLTKLGYAVTVKALARTGAKDRSLARCRALLAAGSLAFWEGRYAVAQDHLRESLSIARELGNEETVANALRILGSVSHAQEDRAVAKRYLEESLALARTIGDKREVCAVLNVLGEVYRCEREWDMAATLYEESLMLSRELGNHRQSAVCLTNMSMVSISRGSAERACGTLLEVLRIAAEIETKVVGQVVIDVSAGLASSVGQWERAARFYGVAEVLSNETGIHRGPEDEAFLAPLIAKAREALGAASYNADEAAGRALSYERAITEVRAWLENRS